MKTNAIVLLALILSLAPLSKAQTAAVTDLSISGLSVSPEVAGKLTRIELVKTQAYSVLDEFDMEALLEGKGDFSGCYGKNCLIQMGEHLKVDVIFSGNIDHISHKIIVTLKMISIKEKKIQKSHSVEFSNQPNEIQRMIEIVLKEILDMETDPEIKRRLQFNPDQITSSNVGKVSNTGPRFGISVVGFGEMNDFFTRNRKDGGLASVPLMSNIGYQFEVEYVGTENFSALFEIIPNIGGMEQGHFIPTLSFLNGFRFGKAGWEFAFGPSFGARRMIEGVYVDNEFMTRTNYAKYHYDNWLNDPGNYDSLGYLNTSYVEPQVSWIKRVDSRGELEFNTNWLMAIGRTFRAGSLNIPVNIYYSGNKYGGVIGTSVGFNIIQSKKSINQNF